MLSANERQKRILSILTVLRSGFHTSLEVATKLRTQKFLVDEVIGKIERAGKILSVRRVGYDRIYYILEDRVGIASVVLMEREYRKRWVSDSAHAMYKFKADLLSVLPDHYGRHPFKVYETKSFVNIHLSQTSPQSKSVMLV